MPTARPWRLARSCVPICDKVDKYIDAGDFPPESKVHPGFGVYSVKKGKPVLSFSCQDKRIAILVDKRKVKLTKRQKYYQCIGGVEPDPKERRHWVWVPTSDALDCCVFPEGFFSNSALPPLGKHELIVRVDGTSDLRPWIDPSKKKGQAGYQQICEADEEIAFPYNYTDDEESESDDESDDFYGPHHR